MKYLVNRETKEHRIAGDDWVDGPVWKTVQADSEGWIKHDGGECPLPGWAAYHAKLRNGSVISVVLVWKHYGDQTDVVAYRPILDDKPVVKESLTTDLIDRLRASHKAASELPDIIAELREVLGDEVINMIAGYGKLANDDLQNMADHFQESVTDFAVNNFFKQAYAEAPAKVKWSKGWARKVRNWIAITEKAQSSCQSRTHRQELKKLQHELSDYLAHGVRKSDEAVDSIADMTDWRNWREGDFVTVHGNCGHYDCLKNGHAYPITRIKDSDVWVDYLCFVEPEINAGELRFHSRPTKEQDNA